MEFIFQKLKNYTPTILDEESYRRYGILIPLVKKEDGIHVLFEVRSLELKSQPGEICFPGGGLEETDRTPMDTAIRETSEELGIDEKYIQDVYPVDYFVQPMEKRMIFPFVGKIERFDLIRPNPGEVKEIFTVPLSYLKEQTPEKHRLDFQLADNDHFPFHLIPGGRNYPWKPRAITEYFYFYKDYIIWGLTAKILHHFLHLIYGRSRSG